MARENKQSMKIIQLLPIHNNNSCKIQIIKHTNPVVLCTQFILMRVTKRATGASSGYIGPHSTFKLYIRFS